jgi:DNA-directed RNA polymerase alpha subunit
MKNVKIMSQWDIRRIVRDEIDKSIAHITEKTIQRICNDYLYRTERGFLDHLARQFGLKVAVPVTQNITDATPIRDLRFTRRTQSCLELADIKTIAELTNKTTSDLLRCRGLGKKTFFEVRNRLKSCGRSLKDE